MTQPHLTIVDHPLVQHKLTLMRDKATSTAGFRRLLREISLLLAYEITRELEMTTTRIETPLCEMDAPMLEGKKLALISILRAGNGLLDGVLELIPAARVGFVGLETFGIASPLRRGRDLRSGKLTNECQPTRVGRRSQRAATRARRTSSSDTT